MNNEARKNRTEYGRTAKVATVAAIGLAAVFGAHEISKDTHPTQAHEQIADRAEPSKVDGDIAGDVAAQLISLQAQYDGDRKIATADVQPDAWALTSTYKITISDGGSIIQDGVNAYKRAHNLPEELPAPSDIENSIVITANSFSDRAHAEDKSSVVQHGDIFELNEVKYTATGEEFAVISNVPVEDQN